MRDGREVSCRWAAVLVLVLAAGGWVPAARADGLTPEQAREAMVLPEGFKATVFASEPEVRQPVAAAFDERGRLWVIEYLQYPNPAGLKPVSVDVYLRTEYDRVPEPPPKGPRGADRIKILEDTDGDGRADKVTTFLEGLNLASALAVGYGGVFVGQAPYLLFYPDRDRDDRPDGDPEVLLSGFGMQDAHATVNSLAWGPDGWLYGAQGSTVTARIRGHEFQQGIWRYHPRTRRFELFAEGGGNTWGLDFDPTGQAFGSSNGGFITFHMVPGGYYWKGFAKHGPLHNPRTYGYFDAIAYDGAKRGGHVTPGGIIYQGDNFPTEFRGAFIGGNLLANGVYWHALKAEGSTFRGRHAGTLIDARDRWFRPVDLLTGPDGALYVVDWYDRRASHLDPRDNWDRSNGRIYKITYGDVPKLGPIDLRGLSSDALVDFRTHADNWYPAMARRLLAERRDAVILPRLRESVLAERDEVRALRDLWALYVSGGFDDGIALKLLDHPAAGVRRWTIRLLGDEFRMGGALREALRDLARNEPDPTVRSQLASSCQRWEPADALPLIEALTARSEDVKDRHIPLLLWWAVERQMRADRGRVLRLFDASDVVERPLVRDFLLERLARALAEGGTAEELAAASRLLGVARSGEAVARVVAGLDKGLEGRGAAEVPGEFAEAVDRALKSSGDSLTALRVAIRLGNPEALRRACTRVGDRGVAVSERRALIEILGQQRAPERLEALRGILGRPDEAAEVIGAALQAIGAFGQDEAAEAVLAAYPGWPAALRDQARSLLCSRPSWARRMLEAMAHGRIAAKDLRPPQVLQIVRLGDATLTAEVERLWGRVPGPGSEAKLRRIAEVRGILPEGDKGDPVRGKAVFAQHCAVCHKLFGEGEPIGPDLTGAERGDLDFLLTSLVDPSALIRKEYEAQTVALGDGRVLTGLVLEETESALTLFDSQRQKTVVSKAEIEERTAATVSVMPEGVLDALTEGEIRDLFRYLQGGPVK